ncbi:hypothetical protein [Tateyamaria omphalii]|uniref:Uncharacterized protein n=1 Tax=Tateyamaria omphalii TaxID=299262 RepID=A0A1P8MZ98_9RHOB|nr:hypothetical protein [Tateyamaria omphalii]APX13417.1 hypothetical protein BWR18_18300 [Tateyamaria omphalii]
MIDRVLAGFLAALVCTGAAHAQDKAAFDAGLGDCARYITAKPVVAWAFQTAPAALCTSTGWKG